MNATPAHAQDFLAYDELLLSTLSAFSQYTRSRQAARRA